MCSLQPSRLRARQTASLDSWYSCTFGVRRTVEWREDFCFHHETHAMGRNRQCLFVFSFSRNFIVRTPGGGYYKNSNFTVSSYHSASIQYNTSSTNRSVLASRSAYSVFQFIIIFCSVTVLFFPLRQRAFPFPARRAQPRGALGGWCRP